MLLRVNRQRCGKRPPRHLPLVMLVQLQRRRRSGTRCVVLREVFWASDVVLGLRLRARHLAPMALRTTIPAVLGTRMHHEPAIGIRAHEPSTVLFLRGKALSHVVALVRLGGRDRGGAWRAIGRVALRAAWLVPLLRLPSCQLTDAALPATIAAKAGVLVHHEITIRVRTSEARASIRRRLIDSGQVRRLGSSFVSAAKCRRIRLGGVCHVRVERRIWWRAGRSSWRLATFASRPMALVGLRSADMTPMALLATIPAIPRVTVHQQPTIRVGASQVFPWHARWGCVLPGCTARPAT
mmetsp:Transcript_80726/g.224699  ORF Transcript_80726/g.224699 Transcript_80726/m.224699 type:complete len:296 (+) Transcript_80726:46-933(+)